MYEILKDINSPDDVKKLNMEELKVLANDIRVRLFNRIFIKRIMYRAGTDINTIKDILGHVQIDTTEIYTHLYDKDVMTAMQTHSLSKFMIQNAKEYCCA